MGHQTASTGEAFPCSHLGSVPLAQWEQKGAVGLGQREMGVPSPVRRKEPGMHHLPRPALHLLYQPLRLIEQPWRGLYLELSSSSYHLS